MTDMQDMIKKAQTLQAEMANAKERLQNREVEGSSGGGLVRAVLTGDNRLKSIFIDPSLLMPAEKEVLEDLVVAAVCDGQSKMASVNQEEMSKAMEGLQLPPGFKMPGM